MDYWKESIQIAAEECGLLMTEEQLNYMAEAMQGSYENYGLYSGHDAIPNPTESQDKRELEGLLRSIAQKEEWINSTDPCRTCATTGTTKDGWGRPQDCPNCSGKGRVMRGW